MSPAQDQSPVLTETREFFFPNPGRVDRDGVTWWRTDGTNSWYRWDEHKKLITKARPSWPVNR